MLSSISTPLAPIAQVGVARGAGPDEVARNDIAVRRQQDPIRIKAVDHQAVHNATAGRDVQPADAVSRRTAIQLDERNGVDSQPRPIGVGARQCAAAIVLGL